MKLDAFLRSRVTIPLWETYHGRYYYDELEQIRSFHNKSLEEIRDRQFKLIKNIISHAYKHVPYYSTKWRELGIHPDDINDWNDFQNLPILTKTDIRNNSDKFISDTSDKNKLIKSGTGGTTDSPIVLYYDNHRAKVKEAEMHYFREMFHWYHGDKVAYLWGAPQDIPNIESFKYKLINRLTYNRLYLFSSLLNEETMTAFLNRINHFKPDIFQGYTNPMYILAKYILKNKKKVCSVKSIVLTAEPCSPHQRHTIEEAFDCEVFTFYGCREGGYVGYECSQHSGYHINCSSLYMEFIKDNRPAEPGQLGNIVFTDLLNFDMPFIRYEIGDVGISDNTSCPCGSPLPLMKFFAGRETDIFVAPDGSLVPGVSFCDRIIEECDGIQQLQFIQNTTDTINVKIVKGPMFSDNDMKLLDEKLFSYFHGKMNIEKEYVNDIPKEKSGKTRFCISNVDKGL
jgi:phenylacetate-CoA ligase